MNDIDSAVMMMMIMMMMMMIIMMMMNDDDDDDDDQGGEGEWRESEAGRGRLHRRVSCSSCGSWQEAGPARCPQLHHGQGGQWPVSGYSGDFRRSGDPCSESQHFQDCPLLLVNLNVLRGSICFKSLFVPGVCCPDNP